MAAQPSIPSQSLPSLAEKRGTLDRLLGSMGPLLIAYSGGVDSAFLAYAAHQVLGEKMLAVLADSPSLARTQLQDAISFAREQEIPLEVIVTAELDRKEYARNLPDRCFHCKDELFEVMEKLRVERGFDRIAYGVNTNDLGDFRPGQKAAKLHRIEAPLVDAGLCKDEIRELARTAGLRIWDKPASACLSSRIEYGRPVTREALSAVECGEDALRQLGFQQIRVRHHGQIVRIELGCNELPRIVAPGMAERLVATFKELGFTYVTLDLEGFRSGSMNALLPVELLAGNQVDGAASERKSELPPAKKDRPMR